ncbi:MAG: autotransporter-associated beta strand repeat-containing protein [Verrucomicrobiae bacterium]|nr:autotransporter-associated beta strand repeat-containing protein [Verrucomicrobiae bacterium]
MGATGTAGGVSEVNGEFDISGAGADIGGTADSFHFIYQPLDDDCEIQARLTSADAGAEAGVMIRETLDAGAANAFAFVSDGTAAFQTRSTTGGSTTSHGSASFSLPCWLRLVRNGNTLAASVSADGNTWTPLGTTSVAMASTTYVGMAVGSGTAGVLAGAVFDNVDANAPPVLGNLVWRGDSAANTWDLGTTANWFVGTDIEPFFDGNLVTFNDRGVNTLPVDLVGTLQPGAISVNASKDYEFAGSGSLAGGLLLSKNGAGTLTLNGTHGFTGSTTVEGGDLRVDGSLTASPATVNAGGTLSGGGTLAGGVTVAAGGRISPGDGTGSAGTLAAPGGLSLTDAALSLDLASTATTGSGVNDLIDLNGGGLNLSGTSTVQLSFLDDFLASGSYTLIDNGGSLAGGSGNLVLDLPSNTRQTFALNASAPGTVNLDVTGTGASLVWDGTSSSAWDLNTTANWLNGATAATFYNLDAVTFNDSSSNGTVTLSGTLEPLKMTVNNASRSYTISGGAIAGRTQLIKSGTGTLTLGGTGNTYSGGTTISGGTLTMNSPSANRYALGSGPVTIRNGGTLKFYTGGSDQLGNSNDIIVPTGETGTMQIPGRFGYSVHFDGRLRGGGTLNLKIDYIRGYYQGDWSQFTGQINVSRSGSATTNEFRIDNPNGYPNAAFFLNDFILFDTIGTGLTVDIGELAGSSGATLGAGSSAGTNPLWRVGWLGTDATFAGVISDAGTTKVTKVGDGTWTLTGNNTYSGLTTLEAGLLQIGDGGNTGSLGTGDVALNAGELIFNRSDDTSFNGNTSGGGIITKRGAGTLTLMGSHTSIGITKVEEGTLAIAGSGSMTGTPSITISTGASLDVSGRTSGGMTMLDGQRLSGTGNVLGDITMEGGSTLSIGSEFGTLGFGDDLGLSEGSTTVLKIRKSSPANDTIHSDGAIVLGGDLLVTQTDATPLVDGDSFQLLDASSIGGSFASVTLPSLTTGLEWNTLALEVTGTVTVRTIPTTAPDTPTGLQANAVSPEQIDLTWSPASGADTYTVKRASTSGGSFSIVATDLVVPAFSDTGLDPGTAYFYVVSATNSIGTSAESGEATATTLAVPEDPPAAPAGLEAVVASTSQINLSWSASEWADTYTVKRSTTSGGAPVAVFAGLATTTFSDTGLTEGVTYYYVVSATNTFGEGPNSAEVSATPATPPTLTAGMANSTSAAVPNGNLNGHTVSSFAMNGGDALVVMITEETTTAITGVKFDGVDMVPGPTADVNPINGRNQGAHIFYLTGITTTSGDIVVSANATATDDFAISAMSLSDIGGVAGSDAEASGATSGTLDLTYANATDGGFVLGCGVNNWWQAASGPVPALQSGNPVNTLYSGYVDTNFGTRHVYGNVASAGSYTDVYTNLYQGSAFATISFEAAPIPAPAAPADTTATAASTNQIDLAWAAAEGATSYNIQRATSSGGPYTTIESGWISTSYSNTGLTQGTAYFYVVTAVNAVGQSNGIEAGAITDADPPVITSAANAGGAQGEVFSYFITATNTPTSFGATGLPAGASVNPSTGEITGQIAVGTHTGITISATNSGGTDLAELTITILSGYEKAVAELYPGLGAPDLDDDHDGVPNLVEVATAGRNPLVADAYGPSAYSISLSPPNAVLRLEKSGVAGVDYVAQRSSDLTPESWSTAGVTVQQDDDSVLEVSSPISGNRAFLRVSIMQNDETSAAP